MVAYKNKYTTLILINDEFIYNLNYYIKMNLKRMIYIIICVIIQFDILVYAEANFQPYYNPEIKQYNNIISLYNRINKNIDNKALYYEYIEIVNNYIKNYGKISLNIYNEKNYFFIMQRLGIAYEKTADVKNAISIYQTLSNEYPSNVNLKKRLLYLYDKTSSCSQAYNAYNQIKLIEPDFKYIYTYCQPKQEKIQNKQYFDNSNTQYKGSFNNINNQPIKKNDKDKYDWISVYIVFFTFWGWIYYVAFSKGENLEEQANLSSTYSIKYRYKRPIKPEISEFGFDKTSFEKIEKIIKNDTAYKAFIYTIPIISMLVVAILFNAPSLFFPIFYIEPFGLIFALIFYFVSIIALTEIKNKCLKFINKEDIKNYYSYTNAIALYEEAKERAYWQQRRYWETLSPYDFETAMGKLFEYLGYNVTVTQKSRDGGIDILIKKGNIIKGVQCKHYTGKVGAKEVRELWGVKDYFKLNNEVHKLDGVIMVALSGVSNAGYEFISRFQEYELWTIDTIMEKSNNASYQYRYD